MPDRETVAKWFEFDYLPRVGAYRKDCKIGCDACMPKHDGDNYCDIDMLSKVLVLLKEQEAVVPINSYGTFRCGNCRNIVGYNDGNGRGYQNNFCSKCGQAVKWDDIRQD